MRIILFDLDKRPRPRVTTPEKGTEGDRTDETMVGLTDIGAIIQRYGGNLAELAAWRGTMAYGDQPPTNLEDAIDVLNRAHDALIDTPFGSLDEAIAAIKDGTIVEKMTKKETKYEEASEGKPSTVEENLSKDGIESAQVEH